MKLNCLAPLRKRAKQLKKRLGITHTEALNRIAEIEGYDSLQEVVDATKATRQTNFDPSRKLEFLEEITTYIIKKLYPGEDIEVQKNGEYYLKEDIQECLKV